VFHLGDLQAKYCSCCPSRVAQVRVLNIPPSRFAALRANASP
jgi:hypothetical protein